MKKLYSLFAAIICAASLSAQNMAVTIDGHSIANGSTYEKYYAEDELDDMDVYGLYPKFILTSKVNGNCFNCGCNPVSAYNITVYIKKLNAGFIENRSIVSVVYQSNIS